MNQKQKEDKVSLKKQVKVQKNLLKNHSLDLLIYDKRSRTKQPHSFQLNTSLTSQPKLNQRRSSQHHSKVPKNFSQKPKNLIQQNIQKIIESSVNVEKDEGKEGENQKFTHQNIRKDQNDNDHEQKIKSITLNLVKKSTTCESSSEGKNQRIKAKNNFKKFKKKKYLAQSDSEEYNPKGSKQNISNYSLNKLFYRNLTSQILNHYTMISNPFYVNMSQLFKKLGNFYAILLNLSYALGKGQIKLEQIYHLRIDKLSNKGFIFCWVENQQTNIAYQMISSWGYEVVDQVVQVKLQEGKIKVQKGDGQFLNSIQHCLVGYKCGNNQHFNYQSKVSNNLLFHHRKISQKQIYEIIEMMVGVQLKCQFYGPVNPRKGWLQITPKQDNLGLQKPILTCFQDCILCEKSIIGPVLVCTQCKGFLKSVYNIKHQYHNNSHSLQMVQCLRKYIGKKPRCFYCQANGEYKCLNCFNVYICTHCYISRDSKADTSHAHSQKFHKYTRYY